MFWALAILAHKGVAVARARAMLGEDLIPLADGMKILPEDSRCFDRPGT